MKHGLHCFGNTAMHWHPRSPGETFVLSGSQSTQVYRYERSMYLTPFLKPRHRFCISVGELVLSLVSKPNKHPEMNDSWISLSFPTWARLFFCSSLDETFVFHRVSTLKRILWKWLKHAFSSAFKSWGKHQDHSSLGETVVSIVTNGNTSV